MLQTTMEVQNERTTHRLYDKWVLWAHLPHDTDWSLKSYKNITTIESVEQLIALYKVIPDTLVKNCMLFLMRDQINPTWEDPKNRNGGCFSFKVINKFVPSIWKRLSYILLGETITNNPKLLRSITGITISPKKSFCIIKVWVSNCIIQNPTLLTDKTGLTMQGCLFKKHKPEY